MEDVVTWCSPVFRRQLKLVFRARDRPVFLAAAGASAALAIAGAVHRLNAQGFHADTATIALNVAAAAIAFAIQWYVRRVVADPARRMVPASLSIVPLAFYLSWAAAVSLTLAMAVTRTHGG